MKKILMIAPSCFPVIGAEAIVNIKLLKALSDSKKFSIDLISRKWKWFKYPSDTLESYNIKLNSIEIIDVDNVINLRTLFQIFFTYIKFGILYKGYHWAYPAWKEVKKKIKHNKYDYVLTKDVPSLVLGYHLKKHYGLKWVATWNDPCPWIMYPKPYGKGLDANLSYMQNKIIEMMREADIHIFPNYRICNYMNKYLNIDKDKCKIVPHVIIPNNQRRNHMFRDKLNLIHSGNLENPRNPETFLHALRKFIDNRPNARIEFTIMGLCETYVNKLIEELNLKQYVSYITSVEYKESLKKLSSYDIAVIIEANCEEGIFLPTKVSDFLQMSIPIFAISPSVGILNDLYMEKQVSYFASVNNVDAIYNELTIIYDDFEKNNIRDIEYISPTMTIDYVVEQYLSI